mgnify:CR=1 FL=1
MKTRKQLKNELQELSEKNRSLLLELQHKNAEIAFKSKVINKMHEIIKEKNLERFF